MALRTRVWSAGKLLVLGGALLATYVLFAAAAMRMAFRAREVQVPDLTNRTANEATRDRCETSAWRSASTRRDGRTRRFRPAGCSAQDPAPGSTARRQRSVRVWLSAGPRASTVPALTGETERAAQMRLAQDGLELARVSEIRLGVYPSDVVVAQDPRREEPRRRRCRCSSIAASRARTTSCPT